MAGEAFRLLACGGRFFIDVFFSHGICTKAYSFVAMVLSIAGLSLGMIDAPMLVPKVPN